MYLNWKLKFKFQLSSLFLFQIATGWREYTVEGNLKTFCLDRVFNFNFNFILNWRRKTTDSLKRKKKICQVIKTIFFHLETQLLRIPNIKRQNARSNKSQNTSSGPRDCHYKIRMDWLRGTRPDGSFRGRSGPTQGRHADPGTEGQLRWSPGPESSGHPKSQAAVQGRVCPALGWPRTTLGSRLVRNSKICWTNLIRI